MAVLAEFLNVIVPVRVLEERYPGGIEGYAAAAPGSTFCRDGVLTRVGFMSPQHVGEWVDHLEAQGLVPVENDRFVDLAVVDQLQGPTLPCDWLVFGQSFKDELSFVASPDEVATDCTVACPPGWTKPEPGGRGFIPLDEIDERVEILGEEDGLLKIRDKKTGQVGYVPPGAFGR